jgi:hypothetical protein
MEVKLADLFAAYVADSTSLLLFLSAGEGELVARAREAEKAPQTSRRICALPFELCRPVATSHLQASRSCEG